MGEDIRLKSAAGEIGAYLATPKGTPKGGIVVIQEIFGVNHHIRAVTDKFAADGYIALAPRFFDHIKPGIELGYTPDTIAEGRGYVMTPGFTDKAVQDADAAIAGAEEARRQEGRGHRLLLGRHDRLAGGDPAQARRGVGLLRRRHPRHQEREGHRADADAFRRQGHAHPDGPRERAAAAASRRRRSSTIRPITASIATSAAAMTRRPRRRRWSGRWRCSPSTLANSDVDGAPAPVSRAHESLR